MITDPFVLVSITFMFPMPMLFIFVVVIELFVVLKAWKWSYFYVKLNIASFFNTLLNTDTNIRKISSLLASM